jgi:hypothetical protein
VELTQRDGNVYEIKWGAAAGRVASSRTTLARNAVADVQRALEIRAGTACLGEFWVAFVQQSGINNPY